MRRPRSLLVGWALILSGSVSGCKGCRSEKPYTPFGVASSLPEIPSGSSQAPAPSASEAESPKPFPGNRSVLAPKQARTWNLGGLELKSPEDRVFERGVVLAGAEPASVVTWTVPADGVAGQAPGELFLHAPDQPGDKLLGWPSFLPTGPSCTLVTELSQNGPTSIKLDLKTACTTALLSRAPTRALLVVTPGASRTPWFGARAADPAPGETLTLELETRDQDGDGRDDFRLLLTVAQDGVFRLPAPFAWFDRAAGPSRDARQPRDELLRVLRQALSRVEKGRDLPAQLALVGGARRWMSSACAEGAASRVFDWEGAPLDCGDLSSVVDLLARVEILAALGLDRPGEALGALSRDGWYFGSMSDKTRSAMLEAISKKVTRVSAHAIALGLRPVPQRPFGYSPLSFQPDGTLLVETAQGLYRRGDDPTPEPVSPDAGDAAWPLEVVTPQGETWSGVTYSCDRSEVALSLTRGSLESAVTDLLAPRPGACRGAPFDPGAPPAPISVEEGLLIALGGSTLPANKPPRAPPRGSAASRNSEHVAVPTALGLFLGGKSPRLLEIEGWRPSMVSGCTVDDRGVRAACVKGADVEIYQARP